MRGDLWTTRVPVDNSGVVRPDRGAPPEFVLLRLSRARLLRELVLAPPVVLVACLAVLGLLANSSLFGGVGRLGGDLAGGRLLPVLDLPATWGSYLAAWHSAGGGSTVPAPAALAVLGLGGLPLGGPVAAVTALFVADAPLAGLAGYLATRRLRVRRQVRALVAAGYALLPPATAAVAQGRLDAVVVHVLAPLVLAGVVAVLRPAAGAPWLSVACATALGLAALAAFAPLVGLVLLLAALIGYVVAPGRPGTTRQRALGVAAVVLLPPALLLPWPVLLLRHPGVLLHGVGAYLAAPPVSLPDLLALRPGGPGSGPAVGALLVVGVFAVLLARPSRAVLPGLGVALLGGLAVAATRLARTPPPGGTAAEPAWPGAALLVVGCGLLWAALAAASTTAPARPRWLATGSVTRVLAVLAAAGVAALATAAVVGLGQGPLRAGGGLRLASTLTNELARTGGAVLVLGGPGQPTRQVSGRVPALTDDLVTTPAAPDRLAGLAARLTGTDRAAARTAVAEAAAGAVVFVVLPDAASADRLRDLAAGLVADAPAASTGQPVLRLLAAGGATTLLAPAQAGRAVRGESPPAQAGSADIVRVDATPPEVAVRVSAGPAGRLLVVGAEHEPGWRASVAGAPVEVGTAWGHLVGVPLPADAADVWVRAPGARREPLLLVQAAAALFTLVAAMPGRRRRD